jgi:cytochrome o ubiquinol oxidase subunit 2
MASKNKKGLELGWIVLIIITALVDLGLLITYLIRGKNIALFNPRGFIAREQHSLMMFVIIVLVAVAIPVISFFFFNAWKYRESSKKAIEVPIDKHSKSLVFGMWVIPTTIMLILASVMWPATHRLAPQKSIDSDKKPLTIQVISLRWKWIFLYPEQGVATVNFVQIPVDTPVQFEMTADETPMSSFWIPNLGGQLYTMTSHVNRLNLMADTPGDYPGSTPEINGDGFTGMKFTTRVSSAKDFHTWAQTVKKTDKKLDSEVYEELLVPSQNNPQTLYSSFDGNLYDNVIMKYTGSMEGHGH